MSTIGNVTAAVVVQPHPKDCLVCGGEGEMWAAPLWWCEGLELRPAWPNTVQVACPWPYGADGLLSALGVSGSVPDGPEGAA